MPVETYIERIPVDSHFAGVDVDNPLDRAKRLRADGWDVTMLIEFAIDARGRRRATGDAILLAARST